MKQLFEQASQRDYLRLNRGAALQRAIRRDGFWPIQVEQRIAWDGHRYAVQLAEHPDRGERRVYYAIVPEWDKVLHWPESEEPEDAPEVTDIADQLPIHPRKRYQSRPVSGLEWITIHHTASGDTTPERIASYHVEHHDWPGIGYHYVIATDGQIFQTQPLATASYHDGHNDESIGICLVGDFERRRPPRAQQEAARKLIRHLQNLAELPPLAVKPHRQVAATRCPGALWRDWLYEVAGIEPVDMAPYFLVPDHAGKAYVLTNNWGEGEETVQLRREGQISILMKNDQFEQRRVGGRFIDLLLDTSPGDGRYYRVEGHWMPRRWAPGERFTRQERVTWYRQGEERPEKSYQSTTIIEFVALHERWPSPAGVLADVIELAWLVENRVDERYFYAPGLGLVCWEKHDGRRSIITRFL